jgi:hypothetical protein
VHPRSQRATVCGQLDFDLLYRRAMFKTRRQKCETNYPAHVTFPDLLSPGDFDLRSGAS